MEKSDITLFLSIWGSALSTVLFLFNIKKIRREAKGTLQIDYKFNEDCSILDIVLINTSFRSISVRSCEFLYYANEFYFQPIMKKEFDQPIKLVESETYRFIVNRSEITGQVEKQKLEQKHYHQLTMRVQTSSSGNFLFYLNVPILSRNSKFYERAGQFISTDIFLGFDPQESFYYRNHKELMKSQ